VAEVSKRWFRIRDTFGIEIAPGEDDALILAVTVCIDQMNPRLSRRTLDGELAARGPVRFAGGDPVPV
jgi:hypothetical protein